jgi:hypothetical protein
MLDLSPQRGAKPDIGQVLRFYEYTPALLWQIYSSCVFTQIHFRQYTATGKQPWYFTRADGQPMTFAANDMLQRWPVSRRVNSSRAPPMIRP